MARRTKRIMKENRSIELKEGVLEYLFIRSSRRRTIVISVDEDGSVSIYAPFYVSEKEVSSFIHERAEWTFEKVREARAHLSKLSQKAFAHGNQFLFLGKKHPIHVVEKDTKRSRIEFDGFKWIVEVPREIEQEDKQTFVKEGLLRWYRAQAEEVLGGRIFHYSRIMGVEPRKIAIRSQKRIWGSCDYNTQAINLNWQIILSPIEVIDYVVVHELCHLLVPDHSKRFWKKVERVLPDYKHTKKWFNTNSVDMHLP